MSLTTFRCFVSLPPELRYRIYILATPPRVVHVREGTEQDYKEFENEFRSTLVQLKPDPSLAHFAFNWRHIIPSSCAQPTLESFGFTGGRARYQPWEPSPSTPEIPLNWLAEQPKIAWEFTRRSYLYSRAPIPALLHACSESRAVLMACGYQLAFQTRSSGPRTWFNFHSDVLFLGVDYNSFSGFARLLSGGPWNVSQFHPRDLRRVRKLALESFAYYIDFPERTIDRDFQSGEISALLRLFGGIEEFLYVEWSGRRDRPPRETKILEPWNCVAAEEVDALTSLFNPGYSWRPLYSTGPGGQMVEEYKKRNGRGACCFRDLQQDMEQRLRSYRDSVVAGQRDRRDKGAAPWQIPKITVAHILPPDEIGFVLQERLSTLRKLHELQAEWASISRSKSTLVQQSSQWQDDETAFAKAHWPEPEPEPSFSSFQAGYDDDEERNQSELKKWWIQEGPIPALDDYRITYIY